MRRHRGGTALACVAIVLAAGLTGAGMAGAAPAPEPGWEPCPGNGTVQCATLRVPLDWARPWRGTIGVAVARRTATEPSARIGTLVLMPGGPGSSGVDSLLAGSPVPPEVAARFDLVTYDPRGSNRSHPVRCDADLVAHQPNLIPEAGATFAAVAEHARKLGASCRRHTGPLLDHVDSVSTARDIDALRAALGERRISLAALSYGTIAAQMYAERFPGRVRAMVLDSVFDHSLGQRRLLATEAATGEDSFAEFARWCARDTACSLHGQDVPAVFDALWTQAVRGELTDPADPARTIDGMTLVTATLRHLAVPDWPAAADRLRALASQEARPAARATEAVPSPRALFCADFHADIDSERQWRALWHVQRRAAPHLRTHYAWAAISTCAAWPARTANPQHRPNIKGTPPILLLNARHDPATGYEWARNVERQIDGSVLLTYDGWGHGVLNRTACTAGAVSRYLIDSTTPAPGTVCPAVPTP